MRICSPGGKSAWSISSGFPGRLHVDAEDRVPVVPGDFRDRALHFLAELIPRLMSSDRTKTTGFPPSSQGCQPIAADPGAAALLRADPRRRPLSPPPPSLCVRCDSSIVRRRSFIKTDGRQPFPRGDSWQRQRSQSKALLSSRRTFSDAKDVDIFFSSQIRRKKRYTFTVVSGRGCFIFGRGGTFERQFSARGQRVIRYLQA